MPVKKITLSTYEAKARFSELLRRVRTQRSRIVVTNHGRPVAEIIPYEEKAESPAERLLRLERDGVLEVSPHPASELGPVARREGALARFLRDRD